MPEFNKEETHPYKHTSRNWPWSSLPNREQETFVPHRIWFTWDEGVSQDTGQSELELG